MSKKAKGHEKCLYLKKEEVSSRHHRELDWEIGNRTNNITDTEREVFEKKAKVPNEKVNKYSYKIILKLHISIFV